MKLELMAAGLCLVLIAAVALRVEAAAAGKAVEYTHNGTQLEGYLSVDEAVQGKRPVVILVHDWNGIDDYEKKRADMLAELGYLAFAADIYGAGVRPQTRDASASEASKYRADPDLFRGRLNAALEAARRQPLGDSSKVAAIGYCFGGQGVLQLARSGADVKGVVSFHGSLDTDKPADKGAIKAELLVLHGAADQGVGPDKVAEFHREMLAANVEYAFSVYPDAPHGFTVWGSDAYNEHADKRSWQEMKVFLERIFR